MVSTLQQKDDVLCTPPLMIVGCGQRRVGISSFRLGIEVQANAACAHGFAGLVGIHSQSIQEDRITGAEGPVCALLARHECMLAAQQQVRYQKGVKV